MMAGLEGKLRAPIGSLIYMINPEKEVAVAGFIISIQKSLVEIGYQLLSDGDGPRPKGARRFPKNRKYHLSKMTDYHVIDWKDAVRSNGQTDLAMAVGDLVVLATYNQILAVTGFVKAMDSNDLHLTHEYPFTSWQKYDQVRWQASSGDKTYCARHFYSKGILIENGKVLAPIAPEAQIVTIDQADEQTMPR